MLRWEGFFQPPDRDFPKLLKTTLFLLIPAAEPGDVKANVKKTPLFLSLFKKTDPGIGSAFLKSVKNLGVFVLSRCRDGISPFLSEVQRFLVLVNHSTADLVRLGTCLVAVSLLWLFVHVEFVLLFS